MKLMIELNIELRSNGPEDRDFIFNTWSNNQRSVGFNSRVRKGEFSRFIKHFLLCRIPEFEIVVACNSEYKDQIYGFIAYSEYKKLGFSCVHFLYVKSIYRNQQIATKLLLETTGTPHYYSCLPSNQEARKIIRNAKYNPFLFYSTENEVNELLQSQNSEICRDN
jgi:GNAT superfamily N-acetyltransferase